MLAAQGVSCSRNGATLLAEASVRLAPGEILAVLGPNGAGKSTLLRLMAGELPASAGRVEINGRSIDHWTPTELARQRAVLPQTDSLRFAFEARDVVALGRYPWGERDDAHAAGIIDSAMQATGVQQFAHRPYTRLSAGERARVQLARVLAQLWEPQAELGRFLLLDEPTANLDLAHQRDVLAVLRRFAHTGAGVLLVLHDLNLALEYADRVLILRDGRVAALGPAREVLTASQVATVFGVEVELLRRSDGSPWIAASGRGSPSPSVG